MVELVTIIVILGIIAVVALPRFADNDAFRDRAAADQARAALSYAQKVAIASHGAVTATIRNRIPPEASNCGTAVAAGALACVLPDDVVLSGVALVTTFDFMGRPFPNAAASAVVGGTTINIEAETGYVH